MAERFIVSWFYQQEPDEGGTYPQVAGDSSVERFRDVYRRCLNTFFTTARLADPEARLLVYLNRPWSCSSSPEAAKVGRRLKQLGVESAVIDSRFRPPETWPAAWRNQFFVFDVLADLASRLDSRDMGIVLDSDIIWSGVPATRDMWGELARAGTISYCPIEDVTEDINGLSTLELRELCTELAPQRDFSDLRYVGGEIIGVRGDQCQRLVELAESAWSTTVGRYERGQAAFLEEAHMLSYLFAHNGLPINNGAAYIKRIWTLPWSLTNATDADLLLPLWHLPAEKQYGLRRLHRKIASNNGDWPLGTEDMRSLGLPRKSIRWAAADFTSMLARRARFRIKMK